MNSQIENTVNELVNENFITEEQQQRALEISKSEADATSPWYVQLMIGTGAWISAILFGVFFGITGIIDTAMAAVILGAILLITTLWFSFSIKKNKPVIFLEQILLASSFAGHTLFIVGIAFLFEDSGIIPAILAVTVSSVFLMFYPNRLHKFISALMLLAGIWYLFHELGLNSLTTTAFMVVIVAGLTAWMWLHESVYLTGKWHQLGRPVQYAFVCAFLYVEGLIEHDHRMFYWGRDDAIDKVFWDFSYVEIVTVGLFVVLSLTLLKILQRLQINGKSLSAIATLFFTLSLCVIFYRSPSIIGSYHWYRAGQ